MGNLQTLAWQLSHLEGEFPRTALQNLTQLQYLDFSYCGLDSAFPPEFDWSAFAELVHLNFMQNSLRGPIPAQIGSLPRLEFLHLGYNHLDGTIPEAFIRGLANRSKITTLNMGDNALQGPISSSFCGIAALETLALNNNNFTGSLPRCTGALRSLSNLDVGYNALTGTIPSSLGQLTNLVSLALDDNQLHGPIPEELGALPQLQTLGLSQNHLQGNLPDGFFHNLTDVVTLRLSQNNLTGTIQGFDLSTMPDLQTFGAYGNAFHGGLPRGPHREPGARHLRRAEEYEPHGIFGRHDCCRHRWLVQAAGVLRQLQPAQW
jgi:Leucine-rich repeat (LRR) protein